MVDQYLGGLPLHCWAEVMVEAKLSSRGYDDKLSPQEFTRTMEVCAHRLGFGPGAWLGSVKGGVSVGCPKVVHTHGGHNCNGETTPVPAGLQAFCSWRNSACALYIHPNPNHPPPDLPPKPESFFPFRPSFRGATTPTRTTESDPPSCTGLFPRGRRGSLSPWCRPWTRRFSW